VLLERGIPRHGYELANSEGQVIGQVTSGTMSPSLNKGIGMGYIAKEYSAFGTQVYVKIRNKAIPAEVVRMPFI
jgi:aminomethyltransferase